MFGQQYSERQLVHSTSPYQCFYNGPAMLPLSSAPLAHKQPSMIKSQVAKKRQAQTKITCSKPACTLCDGDDRRGSIIALLQSCGCWHNQNCVVTNVDALAN